MTFLGFSDHFSQDSMWFWFPRIRESDATLDVPRSIPSPLLPTSTLPKAHHSFAPMAFGIAPTACIFFKPSREGYHRHAPVPTRSSLPPSDGTNAVECCFVDTLWLPFSQSAAHVLVQMCIPHSCPPFHFEAKAPC